MFSLNTVFTVLLMFIGLSCLAQDKKIKACGNDEYPPWNWAAGRELVGTCVDMAKSAFATKGYTLDMTYVGPWSRCQALLEAGRVDVSICAVPTPARFDSFNIIQPNMGINDILPFVHINTKFQINSVEDLYGKRIGLVRGTRLGEPLDSHLIANTEITTVSNSEALWSLLLLQRLDVVLYGRESGNLQIKQLGIGDRVIQMPTALTQVNLNIMVSKKSKFYDEILLDTFDISRFFTHPDYLIKLNKSLKLNSTHYLQTSRKSLPMSDRFVNLSK